ncbi:MAG TPA: GNAT family N-acetyltransferase [Acidimicrobiia bacterium]|nr:GNAT family N-acetyltransferase [Acidimicrobiia bacterium]
MSLRVEPLGDHDVEGFRCGFGELDDWLIRHARTATGQGTRTYVMVDVENSVVGYFAISPHLLERDEAPSRIARGAPQQISAILLAKLALDHSHQGSGLGSELLVFALSTIVDAARRVGGRLVVVDAINEEARRFHQHHDFQPLPGNEHRLIMKLSTTAKALGVDWP